MFSGIQKNKKGTFFRLNSNDHFGANFDRAELADVKENQ